ncbi:hypothetical protein GUJ93_ZPchr2177g28969 [Zizania palustris]|uniref:Uncharacterized protein n=1 Tax=Zizania palustris TaxID=103762 RepID=A0A8J5RF53_ZIZPA|nr:hypothetical protein GUJ93_ZPchr2177g28969 [Zizania palustris]
MGGVRTRAGEIEAAALHRSKFGVLAAAEKTLAKIMASLADYFLADLDELRKKMLRQRKTQRYSDIMQAL